ncbi:hypothetical protein DSLASN_36300 [Desulfoluna limicola]|uniref:Porin domain-containing protein n=1 Tax=Desulfoluna limicola TaxID=2810562 RepID=A0ABN6F7I5_9BACT|nr:hypothetical protein [Desulfoluna limicola]BCS97998.1 hypothetical protein DSLASN_36300 [Desulfoluna limicola]
MFKKVFAAMLAGLFISAPAFAEVKMSGSYFLKGNYRQSAVKAIDDFRYYESDFEVKTSFIVDENTSADVVVEAFDTNWADKGNIAGGEARGAGQNYFEVSKATMTHKFATGTTFNGGIAGDSDSWGTLFGDVADRVYYIKADQALPFGTLTFRTEKYSEGTDGIYNDDKDNDGYLLGLTTEAAGFKLQPALYYSDNQETDVQLSRVMVAAFGNVGAIAIESEFGYEDVSSNTAADEGSTFGAWVDAATNVGGLSINTGLLYSSADDAVSYGVSGELCPMEILGDEVGLDGTTLFRVKVGKSLTEKVAVDFSAAYAFTNKDEADMNPDFTQAPDDKEVSGTDLFDKIYEIDANASYKASDAVTLSTGIAYLDGDLYNKESLPQARIDAYAKIAVAF